MEKPPFACLPSFRCRAEAASILSYFQGLQDSQVFMFVLVVGENDCFLNGIQKKVKIHFLIILFACNALRMICDDLSINNYCW